MNSDNIGTWKVLIVDDEPDNLNVAQKILTFNGATVYTAANGIEGLHLMKQIRMSFVLLDLSMPKMDGWEMCSRAKADPQLKDIPIIALTAHAMGDDRQRALKMGFSGYITKPFRMDTFLHDIRRIIQQLDQKPKQA